MSSRPIIWWLTALLLGSSAVAWAVSMALVLAVPQPLDMGPRVSDAVRALQGREALGRELFRRSRQGEPPFPALSPANPMHMVSNAVAENIRGRLGGEREVRIRLKSFLVAPTSGGTLLRLEKAIEDDDLAMPGSSFAARNSDGSWIVIHSVGPMITTWHVKIFGGFILFALILVPLAYLSAKRMSGPMRQLAAWAREGRYDPPPSTAAAPLEIQQMATALREMREGLHQQMEERTIMLAAVAHDLRSPLTALRLRTESAPPATRARMATDIGRMERMIAQFLEFVSGSGNGSNRADIDLVELVEAVIGEAGEEGLAVCCAPDRELTVRGNAVDLQRMVRNLLENARHYGRCATVHLAENGSWVTLTVSDEGPGLPPDELQRVLQPFYRPDTARNSAAGGTGLGLAIVQMIARAHGGDVSLRNRLPHGLEAEVRLPRSPAETCAPGLPARVGAI